MIDLEPSEFYLSQNYPNPFSDKTSIKFCVAYKGKVELHVFNPDGELIKILLNEEKEAGTYEVEFSAFGLCDGVYIYQLKVGEFISIKKMLIVKTFEV